jgi:iron complex outermembrane receptor protein
MKNSIETISKRSSAFCFLLGVSGLAISPAWGQAVKEIPADVPASASENDSEIVVTGSRLRDEAVQTTPIAVSVVGPRQIDALHGSDIRALGSLIPNLNITDVPVAPGLAGISLRGFTSRNNDIAVEPGIAVYIDGVYQNITTNSLTGLFDLDKLEVLRGPQGTLLGKNAAAGALLLTRSRPTGELGVKAQVEYGSFNLFQAQGLLNFPIIDGVLSGKLFAEYRRRDGFVKNLATGGTNADERRGGVRGALLLTPSDNLEVYASMDYQWNRSDQFPGREVSSNSSLACIVFGACGLAVGQRSTTYATFFPSPPKSNDYNGVINAQLEAGAVKISAITGYRKLYSSNTTDADGTPFPIIEVPDQVTKLKKFSQEVRLSSVDGGGLDMDGKLAWLIAAYYDKSTSTFSQPLIAFGSPSAQGQRIVRDSKAVFGQIEYELIDRLKLTFGARKSWDKTTHDYSLSMPGLTVPPLAYSQSAKFSNASFEGGTHYEIDESKMVYFRFSEGYRGGGFIGLPTSVATAVSYNPETSTSYEAGVKTQWLDGALLFNVTLFDVRFKNLQRSVEIQGPGNTFVQVTRNAASATTKGVEIESVIRPSRNFTVRANFGYLDAKYNKYLSLDTATGAPIDLSGLPLIAAPKYTAGVSADYSVDLGSNIVGFNKVVFHANIDFKSAIEYSEKRDIAGHQPAYETIDGSVSMLSDAGYSIDLYVKNVFDKRYITYGDNVAGLFSYQFDDIGRTLGASLKLNF